MRATILAVAFFMLSFADLVAAQPNRDVALRTFLRTYLRSIVGAYDEARTTYSAAFLSTKNSNRQLVIVYVSGEGWCGTGGCNMFVLEQTPTGFTEICRATIVRPPIYELPTVHHGLPDIAVFVRGGGIVHDYFAELSYDGRTYPANPTVPPARPLGRKPYGTAVISENAEEHLLY